MENHFQSYYLSATGDKTDRSREIEEILERDKVCVLGPGTFTVTGITMPPSSALLGLGEASIILLDESVEDGAAVKLGSFCSVKNLCIQGSEKTLSHPERIGTRHGILYLSNVTPQDSGNPPRKEILSDLRIHSFSGGGITCHDTGYSIDSSICATNIRIHGCGAGINISHFSEYHKFTNVTCTRNLFGCIQNGGNNVFCACSFDGNETGFVIDNSRKQSNNNAHGSAVGCTFNHMGGNKGVGIHIMGSNPGYVFSACQIFFSQIVVENSGGIHFADCNLGRGEKIFVRGGGRFMMTDCTFGQPPVITVENNPYTTFRDLYLRSGESVLPDAVTYLESKEEENA